MRRHRITVSLDVEALQILRAYASKRSMTVSSLICFFLEELAKRERRALEARAKMHAVPPAEAPTISEVDGATPNSPN